MNGRQVSTDVPGHSVREGQGLMPSGTRYSRSGLLSGYARAKLAATKMGSKLQAEMCLTHSLGLLAIKKRSNGVMEIREEHKLAGMIFTDSKRVPVDEPGIDL